MTTCSAVTTPCSVSSCQRPSGHGREREHAVAQDHVRAAFLCRCRERMRRAVRIESAFVRVEETAEQPCRVHNRTVGDDLLGRGEACADAERFVNRGFRLEPFPARRSRGKAIAARHVHADVLPALLLDLRVQLDGVRLQRRNVRIVVEHVKAGRGVPRRSGSELRPFDERNVGPAEPGQMIEHARAHDAPADHDHPIMSLQVRIPRMSRQV